MGFFSKKSDDLLQESTDTGRAAYKAARRGETVTGSAYKAQSDASFEAWLDQTQAEYEANKGS